MRRVLALFLIVVTAACAPTTNVPVIPTLNLPLLRDAREVKGRTCSAAARGVFASLEEDEAYKVLGSRCYGLVEGRYSFDQTVKLVSQQLETKNFELAIEFPDEMEEGGAYTKQGWTRKDGLVLFMVYAEVEDVIVVVSVAAQVDLDDV